MNISSISNVTAAGATARPAGQDAPALEAKQARASQQSSSTQVLTERPVSQTQKAESTRQQLEEAVKAVNDFLAPINNSIQFNLDDESGRTIIKVIDVTTKDVIRQFPSEEMLSIAKALDKMKGLLVQQKA